MACCAVNVMNSGPTSYFLKIAAAFVRGRVLQGKSLNSPARRPACSGRATVPKIVLDKLAQKLDIPDMTEAHRVEYVVSYRESV